MDYGNTLGALSGAIGAFMSGQSGGRDYYKGMVDGAQARRLAAQATLDERKQGNIDKAIQMALAGDFSGANAHSLYGYGGKTAYAPTSSGAIFNAITGTLNENSLMHQAAVDKLSAQSAAERAQARQYRSAAGLNDMRANAVRDLLPYDQMQRTAEAQSDFADASRRYSEAQQVADLTAYKQLQAAAAAQNQFSAADRNRSAAGLNDMRAAQVGELTPHQVLKLMAEGRKAEADANEAEAFAGAGNIDEDVSGDWLSGAGMGDLLNIGLTAVKPPFVWTYGDKAKPAASAATDAGGDIYAEAQAAIDAGADPAQVAARLKAMGY